MNLGSSPNDFPLIIFTTLGMLALLPAIAIIISVIARLLSRLLSVSSGWIMATLVIIVFWGGVAGGSYYLDTSALTVIGDVVNKSEVVETKLDGSWKYRFNASFQYPYRGEINSVTLYLNETRLDELQQGKSAALKLLPLYRTLAIVKLASLSTWEWISTPVRWIVIGAVSLFLFFQAVKSKIGCAILAIIGLLLAIGIPTLLTYRAWQSAENIAARPLRAQATITKVTRFTQIDYLPCYRNCSRDFNSKFEAKQPFDVVQMEYLPEGRSETLLAVDSADVGSFSGREGGVISIAYTKEYPRDVQIINATHSHHWRNAIYFIVTYTGALFLCYGVWFLVQWLIKKAGQSHFSS